MKKPFKSSNSISNYSRAQTAKIRKTLTQTLKNIRNKKLNEDSKSNYLINKRPKTATTYFQNLKIINPIYLQTNSNINNKNSSFKNFTRPSTAKYNLTSKLTDKSEYQKAHLNEVNIQNLFTEKLWEKNNKEKNEDYTKKLAYKKLIMRARLLKAMKNNIVLKQSKYNEYNEKYSKGNKLLSEKLKNRNKFQKDDIDDDSYSESTEKEPPPPNFNSLKHPDIFSNYEFTSLFKDYHCTPLELIKKIFNPEEQKIINLDPIFFRLNKEPFTCVQKNLRFNLKDKINEEDRIFQQKLKMAKERNKKFYFLRKKNEEKQIKKGKKVKSVSSLSENEKNEFDDNIEIIPKKKNITAIENKSKSNAIKSFNQSKIKQNKKNKKYKIKENKNLKIIRNNKKNIIDFNINTEYNVYLETKKANFKKRIAEIDDRMMTQLYSEEEKIKDKKKKLTMQELFEMYNERKKTYLDDMSYNRTRNKYRFEQLRIKHHENMEYEKQKKENLRQIMLKIEQNYKLYQK